MTTIAIVGAGKGLGLRRLWAIHTERGDFRTYAEALPELA
jgi:hypothetical protein